jgi:hypothetical protein
MDPQNLSLGSRLTQRPSIIYAEKTYVLTLLHMALLHGFELFLAKVPVYNDLIQFAHGRSEFLMVNIA